MATYQIQVNEHSSFGKSLLAMLSAIPETVSVKKIEQKESAKKAEKHSPLYYDLQEAFRDVKLMVDGKKRKKTAEEFLYELQNSND
jgi:hypothetical protein